MAPGRKVANMSDYVLPAVKSVRHWAGQWIWVKGEAKPRHFYLYARRAFELAGPVRSALLRVTAADRYVLYINGVYVGRGPARSDPRRKSYDTYQVAQHLAPGANVVAIRAYHYGTPARGGEGWGGWSGNAYSVGERAGLWAQLDLELADGQSGVIATDQAWRVQPARSWRRDVELVNSLVGWTEVYDASADPVDWFAPDFDDSAWRCAWVLPPDEMEWTLLEERETPLLEEREAFPSRLVTVGEVIDLGNRRQSDIPGLLDTEPHFPLEHARAENAAAVLVGDGSAAQLQGRFAHEHGIRAPYLILDFGRQLFGFPRVRLRAKKGAILDMTYAQQLIGGRIPAALRYGDRYIARDGEQTWEVAEYKQFRYLHLTVRSTFDPVEVESISINEYLYPVERRGRFESSDPLLNSLWRACADTAYLNFEDTLVHEGYRERAIFNTGDGSHIMHMAFAGFGALPLTDRFLRLVPFSGRGDGMLQMVYPPENPQRYVVSSFLLQWSSRVREHYLFTGREPVLRELYRSVPPQIDWYEPHRDTMGLLRDLPLQNTIDWTPNDLRGASFIFNALYVKGLEDAAWLADRVGDPADAVRWRRIASEVRATARREFWDEQQELFADSHFEGGPTGVFSDLANAYAILYGIAAPEQSDRIASRLTRGVPGLVEATPLFYGFVFDALMSAGYCAEALELTRRRFRPMLEAADPPTIWELWHPFTGGHRIVDSSGRERIDQENRVRPMPVRSLAHTGGVLAGYVLSTRVLGVMPTAPGFAQCRIHPRLGDLAWARGCFPSCRGDILVECRRGGEHTRLEIEIPQGVEAEVVLDRQPGRDAVLVHNGRTVDLRDSGAAAEQGVTVATATVHVRAGAGTHALHLNGGS